MLFSTLFILYKITWSFILILSVCFTVFCFQFVYVLCRVVFKERVHQGWLKFTTRPKRPRIDSEGLALMTTRNSNWQRTNKAGDWKLLTLRKLKDKSLRDWNWQHESTTHFLCVIHCSFEWLFNRTWSYISRGTHQHVCSWNHTFQRHAIRVDTNSLQTVCSDTRRWRWRQIPSKRAMRYPYLQRGAQGGHSYTRLAYRARGNKLSTQAVSYTHLTLPTILLV